MFRRSSESLALSEASLLALRPALNTPVLNTDFLPVGPASAAIVVFAEEYGGIGLAIGVRSNEGGQIAVFRNQEPIEAMTNLADALEPALATAEQMGFLFDEDLVEGAPDGQGRAQALALWGQLMGELEMAAAPSPPETGIDASSTSPSSLDAPIPELLLDDVATLEVPEISLDLENELRPVESVVPPTPERQQLSKFRKTEPATYSNAARPGPGTEKASELGRIPIVRIRREATKRVPFLARLLSSF